MQKQQFTLQNFQPYPFRHPSNLDSFFPVYGLYEPTPAHHKFIPDSFITQIYANCANSRHQVIPIKAHIFYLLWQSLDCGHTGGGRGVLSWRSFSRTEPTFVHHYFIFLKPSIYFLVHSGRSAMLQDVTSNGFQTADIEHTQWHVRACAHTNTQTKT